MSSAVTHLLTERHFQGGGRLQGKQVDHLARILRSMLQRSARMRVERLNKAPLTDSSGGTAGMVFTAATTDICTFAVSQPGLQLPSVSGGIPLKAYGPYRLVNVGGALPTGLAAATDYYLEPLSATTFYLHTSLDNAILSKPPVNVTATGSGTHYLLAVGARPGLVENDVTGDTTGVTKASLNTAADTVMNAYATLMGRINSVRTVLGMGSLNDGPGTDGAGTIAAVDDTASANTTDDDAADYASAVAVLDDLDDALNTVVTALSQVRVAVGLATVPVLGNLPGDVEQGLDINQGAAIVDATDGTDSAASAVLLAEWDAALDVHSDNIAYLADLLDEVTAFQGEIITESSKTYQAALGTAGSYFLVSPVSGRIRAVLCQVTTVIGTGDSIVTVEIEGSAVAGASLTVAATTAIGKILRDAVADTQLPGVATGNYVRKGQLIELVNDGGSDAGAGALWVEIAETGETDLYQEYAAS